MKGEAWKEVSVRTGRYQGPVFFLAARNLINFNAHLFVAVVAFCSFFSAREDFSYDYAFYIDYFESIKLMQYVDVFSSLQNTSPFIYVSVPPSGALEVGFVLLVKSLFFFTESSGLVYALIATASLMLRVFAMRVLGIGWGWILFINLCAITLFEANAIRAGCALTLVILGGVSFLRGRQLVGSALLILSVAFHIQAAFVVLFFYFFWLFHGFLNRNFLNLALVVLGLGTVGVVVPLVLSWLRFSKAVDYEGIHAASVGFNSVSLTGLLLVGAFFCKTIFSRRYMAEIAGAEWRSLLPFLISSVPALSALVFATSLGAIGDRLWQFSFVIFSVFVLRVGVSDSFRFVINFLLILCLVVFSLNVLVRYPLSNFFYPLIPYVEIVPLV